MTAVSVAGLCGWFVGAAAVVWALVSGWDRGARREAVARACHELRGPITAARLGAALMLRGGDVSLSVVRAIDLELSRAAVALDDLARDGGVIAPPTRLAFEAVDVPELLEDCVESARAGARARALRLELRWCHGSERAAWGDRVRLAQAVRNLIANAVEHGEGDIVVRGRGDGGTVRIEVIDHGRGLPAPVADLTPRPRAGRGARGRGLAIAAEIAERHGGRLAAAPTEQGARLVLEIPAASGAGCAAGGS